MDSPIKTNILKKRIFITVVFFFTVCFELIAQTPQYYNYNTFGAANAFPFNIILGKRVQLLYLRGEFNHPAPVIPGNITSISFFMHDTLGPVLYSNFIIRLGQSNITTFVPGDWYNIPFDTVYSRDTVTLTGSSGKWLTFTLDRPYYYDTSKSLILDLQQCSAPGASGFSSSVSALSGNRRISSLPGSSCPFPYGSANYSLNHLGLNITAVSAINNNQASIPNQYYLHQNYPNPFNPVTKIKFDLPNQDFVMLKVYDISGREVSTLVNENLNPGTYEASFRGDNLSSGIYFYKLSANNFSETKRMMFVK